MRFTATIDVPDEQIEEGAADVIAAIRARLIDECGYTDEGNPYMPTAVDVALV